MISVYDEKKNCCGCGVCSLVCPTGCISMKSDSEGFPFPCIAQDRCLDCGICKNSCVFQNSYYYDTNNPLVFAVKHKNELIRSESTSGGVFTAISDYVLENGGIVFGCMLDKNLRAVHSFAETKKDRDMFRGSKYVKSDLGESFVQAKHFVESGRIVLFSGTPCQTAAIRGFIKNDNLVTLDFVCHGTPSPLLFEEYLKYVEQQDKIAIKSHLFRTKHNGWHSHTEENVYVNGKHDYESRNSQLFKDLFYSNLNLNLNLSCYNCPYTNFERPSDLTMGDFWGIEYCMPEFDDNKGVSLLLINSAKGNKLFDEIKKSVDYVERSKNDCTLNGKQLHLKQPNAIHPNRQKFWNDFSKKGFGYSVNKHLKRRLLLNIKNNSIITVKKVCQKCGVYDIAKKIYIIFRTKTNKNVI